MKVSYRNIAMVSALAILLIPTTAAAQGVLFVEGGNVGIGTATPSEAFHVWSNSVAKMIQNENVNATAAERIMFRLINKGKIRFVLNNTGAGASWTFDNDGNFSISKVGTGVNEMLVDGNGNMTIQGTLTQLSDVNLKSDFAAVDNSEILDRVLALPISEWSYKDDGPSIRHIGPMAQDFYGAFELGQGDTGISSLDTSGVAFAAIQGLHAIVEEKDQEIATLRKELEDLRTMVLEQIN